jgi:hypothetical protein
MEELGSSETLVSTYKSTRLDNQQDQHRHFYCRENLKSVWTESFASANYEEGNKEFFTTRNELNLHSLAAFFCMGAKLGLLL